MNALLANRAVRRRGAAYVTLLVASMLLLAVSSNPLVRDLQHGIALLEREEPVGSILLLLDRSPENIKVIGVDLAEELDHGCSLRDGYA